MREFEHDLVVVGGGSGGVRAARVAAQLGARVALIEGGRLGGTCVNVGCIPKKIMVFGARYGADLEDMRGYGWTVGDVRFDWGTLRKGRDAEVARLNGVYRRLLEDSGVKVVDGWAKVTGAHTVEVDGRTLSARHLLIAVGGTPRRFTPPELPGAELAMTSDDFFALDHLPRRVLVVGGGYIACELACVLDGLGAEVTLIQRGTALLRGFDQDLRHEIGNEIRARGVHLHLETGLRRLERRPDGAIAATLDDEAIEVDAVLTAIGRVPLTGGLGLAEAGVALSPTGGVLVDDEFCTTVPSIHAVGDCIERLQLTPVALAEAMVLVHRLFASEDRIMDYRDIPTAVFTIPPLATVGLTEEDARKHGPVRIFKSSFTPLRHRLTGREERALVKLVVDATTDRVLGVHVLGEDAPEMIQGFAVALKCEVTKARLDTTIGLHPTIAEELVTLRREWNPDK